MIDQSPMHRGKGPRESSGATAGRLDKPLPRTPHGVAHPSAQVLGKHGVRQTRFQEHGQLADGGLELAGLLLDRLPISLLPKPLARSYGQARLQIRQISQPSHQLILEKSLPDRGGRSGAGGSGVGGGSRRSAGQSLSEAGVFRLFFIRPSCIAFMMSASWARKNA
jgi:hypothetical protein